MFKMSALSLAISAALGNKESALQTIADGIEIAVSQIVLHGNKTALETAVKDLQGKKGAKQSAIMAALQTVVKRDLKKAKLSADDAAVFAADVAADAYAELLAAWPVKKELSDADKKTAAAEKEVKAKAAAVVLAQSLGMVDAAALPKALTVREALASMSLAELLDVVALAAVEIEKYKALEAAAKINFAASQAQATAEKFEAAEKDAAAREHNEALI